MSTTEKPLPIVPSSAPPTRFDLRAPQHPEPTLVIEAPRGLVPLRLREVWEYRELLYFMLVRDLKAQYRQMALGPLWVILQPVLNTIIYTVIFGVVAKLPSDGIPYPLFAYASLLPWTFFAGAVGGTSSSLLNYRNIISKIYFPRLIVPLVGSAVGLVDFLVSFAILIGLMFYYGFRPSWTVVFVPVFMLLAEMTALAVGLWVASWIVHYRDVGNLVGFALRGWMYATPVVYSISLIPPQWLPLYRLNPLMNIVEGFRWAVLGVGQPPDIYLLISYLVVLPLLISGAYYFRRTELDIVDVV